MSTGIKRPSGWLQQHYDKLALLVLLVALIGSAVVLALGVQGETATQASPSSLDAVNPIAAAPVTTEKFDAVLASVQQPFQAGVDVQRMLVGGLREASIPDGIPIPYEALVCPFTDAVQPPIRTITERDDDADGMPNVWEEKYGFNPYDHADASADPDGDGFTNAEEFGYDTDPSDAASKPPLVVKLRVAKTAIEPFKLRFLGVNQLSAGDVYQLNARNLSQTYFPAMGDEVEGYTVIGYEPTPPEGLPVLILQQGDKIKRLVQGQVVDEEALVAGLISLVDGRRYTVRIGDTISLEDTEYKVFDIRKDRVVLRMKGDEKEIPITMMSPNDRTSQVESSAL